MGLKNVFGNVVRSSKVQSRTIPQRQDDMEFNARWETFRDGIVERVRNVLGSNYEVRFTVDKRTYNIVTLINIKTHERFPLCFVHKGTPGRDGDGAVYEGYIFKAMSEVAPYSPAQLKNPKTGEVRDNSETRSAVGSLWSDACGLDAIKDDCTGCVGQR